MNLFMKQNNTQTEKRLVVAKGKGGVGGMDWDLGVGRCKLLHIGWMDNKSVCIAQGTIFNIL